MEQAIQNFEKALKKLVQEIWKKIKPVVDHLKKKYSEWQAQRAEKAEIADEDRPRTFLDEDQDVDNDAERIATAVIQGIDHDYNRLRSDIVYDTEFKKIIKRAIKKELKK